MFPLFDRFLRNRDGATSIEYALICACIFLLIIGSIQLFAARGTAIFAAVATAVDDAIG